MAAKPLKLLIAEDDRDLCQAYTQAIHEFNGKIQVKIATDGSQAANLVRTERFDGLIIDVRLPTMNGLQVGQIARDSQLNKKTPIIVISGNLDQESHQRAGGLGHVRVMEKPPRMAEAVTKAMAKKSEKSGLSMRCHLIEILYGSGSSILARAGTQVITMPFQLDGQPVHADLVLNAANPGAQ
ncbi:MAG: response regulator [Proteobacteria bacterium]|nr:response regulator [Pseudomonadota bacterium]